MKSQSKPIVFIKRFLCICLCLASSMAHCDTERDYENALTSFNKEEFRESYIHLKNALQKSPQHLPSKLLIGRIFLIDGYPDAAITEFEEVVQAGADPNLVILPLANAYLMSGQFEKIIELNVPSNATRTTVLDIYLLKAYAYIQKKEFRLAESLFIDAKNTFGNDIRVMNGLAQIALLSKDLTKADEIVDQALVIAPEHAQSHLLRGLVYQAEERNDQALASFETAYQFAPKDIAILRALSNSYVQAGNLSKASEIISEIELQNPDSIQTKLLKARLLAMSEKNTEADALLTELSQTLSLADKTNKEYIAKVSVTAGIIAYLNKNYELSVQELSRYLRTEEPTAELVAMLAEGYIRTNDRISASELLTRYESLILDNMQIASLSCDLYLSQNKVFKCISLVQQLKRHHGADSQAVILLEAKILNRRNNPQEALNILQTTLADDKNTDTILFRANLLASIGRYEESLKDAKYLLTTEPDRLDLQLLNIDLLIRLKDFDKANTLLEKVFQQSPNNAAALIHQSRIRFAFGDLQGADASIQKVIKLDKANYSALFLSGQILIKQNRLNDATDHLIAAKSVNATSVSPRELLVSIYKQQGNFKLAISELNQLLKLRPLAPEYNYEKAKIYVLLKQPEEAKSKLDLLFSQWEKQPEKLLQLSRVQLENKDTKGAETSLKTALQQAPDNLMLQLEYSKFLLTIKAFSRAESQITKMQKSFPKNANVHFVKGHFYKETGKLEKAYQQYYKTYFLAPDFSAVLIELYSLATQKVHRADIIYIFEKQVESQSGTHFSRHLYADLLFIDGQLDEARKQYEKLIQVEKLVNKANIYNNLANILSSSDIDKAIAYSQEAVKLDPDSSPILDTLGWLHTTNNDPQQGLNVLRQAFVLDSNNPNIRYHLAYTLSKLGRSEDAKSELKFALDSSQEFKERKAAQALMLEL